MSRATPSTKRDAPGVAALVGGERGRAKTRSRAAAGVRRAKAAGDELLGFALDVELEFLV